MGDVNARLQQVRDDIIAIAKGLIKTSADAQAAEIAELRKEIVSLAADNKRLHQKILEAEGDSAAAIDICKKQLTRIDLLVGFITSDKEKLERRFVKEGYELRRTWKRLQLLEELDPHAKTLSRSDHEDITDLIGANSGFSDELKKLVRD